MGDRKGLGGGGGVRDEFGPLPDQYLDRDIKSLEHVRGWGGDNSKNNHNILHSSQWEIKVVVRPHNEEHISIILSREPHAYTHSQTYAPFLSIWWNGSS